MWSLQADAQDWVEIVPGPLDDYDPSERQSTEPEQPLSPVPVQAPPPARLQSPRSISVQHPVGPVAWASILAVG